MPVSFAADPAPKPCKICKASAPLFGVVDFHKSCIEYYGQHLDLAGIPIYYRRCPQCAFVFTDAFDDWSDEDFKTHIYNSEYYQIIDPSYNGERPTMKAELIDGLFAVEKNSLRLLDYGGGNGMLAALLREKGYNAETYDPYSDHNVRPEGRANLITSFEVFEHTTNPLGTLDDLLTFLEPDGLIVVSTSLQPQDFDSQRLNWWYVGPRNGHVSIHSAASLKKLFEMRGLTVISVDENTHVAKAIDRE